MSAYSIPEFAKLRATPGAPFPSSSWLSALRPTKFEVIFRESYEDKMTARRRKEKKRWYKKNRAKILKRVRARRAKGKKK